ncbi:MAG: type III-A CRISPR-associated protein Csm2 [Chlorobi bacterium]|nr:type III-A CRISPR-associated protein Csm2 [Chlorobiota bacterium]
MNVHNSRKRHHSYSGIRIRDWISNGFTLRDLELLRKFVHNKIVYNNVSVSKLRKFYESVVKMRAFIHDPDSCKRLAYKMYVLLHYELGRDKNPGVRILLDNIISPAIKELDNSNWDSNKLRNFIDLMESVVAFHREKTKQN